MALVSVLWLGFDELGITDDVPCLLVGVAVASKRARDQPESGVLS